jgi:penicillin-binding protein 2
MCSAFGLGSQTGVPLEHEATGVIPDDAWKRKHHPKEGKWSAGDSVNMSIGQGDVLVTPIQMALVASTIANGGMVYKPRMVLEIQTPEGESVLDFEPIVQGRLPVSPQNMQAMRDAMANVVENGTARRVKEALYKEEKDAPKLTHIKVAGKTGSAQKEERDRRTGESVKQTRTWLISFAPYQEPRYAMAVIAEGGDAGGTTAGPLSGTIYRKIFQLEEERKSPNTAGARGSRRPAAVAATPVSEKVAGFEGEVTGELLEDSSMPIQPTTTDETEVQPNSLPAEKVNLP